MIVKLFVDEEGQTLVEYGLLLSLLGVVCIGILLLMGQKVRDSFVQVNTRVTSTS